MGGAFNPGPPQERPQRGGGPRREWGASSGISPRFPETTARGSRDARHAANYVAQMGFQRRFTLARSPLRNRAPNAVRADNSRSRRPPSLRPGSAPSSQNWGGVGPWPSSPPSPPPQATSGQRHQEGSDPMEVEPIRGEALMETRRSHPRQGRIEGGGDRSRVEDGTTPRRRANGKGPPLASLSRKGTTSHERHRASRPTSIHLAPFLHNRR